VSDPRYIPEPHAVFSFSYKHIHNLSTITTFPTTLPTQSSSRNHDRGLFPITPTIPLHPSLPPYHQSSCPTPSSNLNTPSSHSPKALISSTLRPLLAHTQSESLHLLHTIGTSMLTITPRLMHKHTLQQLEAAARSASRRGSSAPSHQGSLSSESSLESESSDL